MKLLAEGPAANYNTSIAPEWDSNPPPATESLFEHWLPRFVACTTEAALKAKTVQGERAILQHASSNKPEIELPSDEEEAMKKVAEAYEGVPPIEVARRLAASPGWVRKARKDNRRDEESGQKRPKWAGWSDDERLDEAKRARARGWSLRKFAEESAAPRTTVHRHYGHLWT